MRMLYYGTRMRIVLFAAMNIAVLAVIAVVLRLLGLDRIAIGQGGEISYGQLLAGSAVYGFVGSIISLLMSKTMAKWSTGARVIERAQNQTEAWLVSTVHEQAKRAGIGMPDVAIYDSPDLNAFATGARRNSALIAVSTGLLQSLQPAEVEAVLAHEISHVANGDMVTMTLLQGVMNTFVIFFSRVIGFAVDAALRGKNDRRGGAGIGSYLVQMVLQMVFGFAASLVLAWFSRRREFRADAGSASLRGPDAMVAALQALQRDQSVGALPRGVAALGIRGGGGILGLLRTHPPLEDRIAALRAGVR
jgi:heat shock protein HtpX